MTLRGHDFNDLNLRSSINDVTLKEGEGAYVGWYKMAIRINVQGIRYNGRNGVKKEGGLKN